MDLFPFGVFFELLLGWAATSDERERRRREQRTLVGVAAALEDGRERRPWFGRPCAEGRVDGRSVRVTLLGRGEVEVTAAAPGAVELGAGRSWLWQLLGADVARAWGGSESRHEEARRLVREGEVLRLDVREGRLVARARPGAFTEASILTLVERLMAMVWSLPAPTAAALRASPRATVTPGVVVRAAPAGPAAEALRCPFCHDALAPDGVVVRCASCETAHHPTCFEEGHGCSIEGCAQRVARGVRAPTR